MSEGGTRVAYLKNGLKLEAAVVHHRGGLGETDERAPDAGSSTKVELSAYAGASGRSASAPARGLRV
jgi:hypothetical protein